MSFLIYNKFKIGDVISFDVHVTGVLTQDYDNVRVQGIVPAKACANYGYDVYALHAQIFRMIPSGTMQDDPESYQYLLVETLDNQWKIVGLPWINQETIRVHTQTSAIFTVPNIAQEDINRIRDVINRHGYSCNVDIR